MLSRGRGTFQYLVSDKLLMDGALIHRGRPEIGMISEATVALRLVTTHPEATKAPARRRPEVTEDELAQGWRALHAAHTGDLTFPSPHLPDGAEPSSAPAA